jgi:hypothetical protein
MQHGSCEFLTPGMQCEGNFHALGLSTSRAYHCARIQCSESTSTSLHMHTPLCIHTRVLGFTHDVRIGMAWVGIMMHMWMLSTVHALDIN